MGYDAAINKAWQELEALGAENNLSVEFLADEYGVAVKERSVLSLSCNIPAKDHTTILVLHYLAKRLKGLPKITGEWVPFEQFEGGQGYYPAFKKRVIDVLVRKYGRNPESVFEALKRFRAKKLDLADVSASAEVFEGVPLLIELERGDEEFGPAAHVFFDKSIKGIFCTEDIVVLAESLVHNI